MSVNVELAEYKRRFPLATVEITCLGYRVNIRTFGGTYSAYNTCEILAWRKAIEMISNKDDKEC